MFQSIIKMTRSTRRNPPSRPFGHLKAAGIAGLMMALPLAAAPAAADPLLGSYPLIPFKNNSSGQTFEQITGVNMGLWQDFLGPNQPWSALAGVGENSGIPEAKRRLARFPGMRIALSYPGISKQPLPSGQTGSLEACARGDYNETYYKPYARQLRAAPALRNVIIRVGWEWNSDTTAMSVNGDISRADLYAACFRQVVISMRAVYPRSEGGPLFDYNATLEIKIQSTPPRGNLLAAAYPGDPYVDYVSVEGYDVRGPAYTGDFQQRIERWRVVGDIFNFVRDFGQARGKKFAIPEWAVCNNCVLPNDGGDSAYHVEQVCKYARDPSNNVGYLAYFNGGSSSVGLDLRENPNALASFRTHCRNVP